MLIPGSRFILLENFRFIYFSSFFLTDTVHPLNFDWTRSDVEPLWLYEHVEAAKWNVQEVAAFVKWVSSLLMSCYLRSFGIYRIRHSNKDNGKIPCVLVINVKEILRLWTSFGWRQILRGRIAWEKPNHPRSGISIPSADCVKNAFFVLSTNSDKNIISF